VNEYVLKCDLDVPVSERTVWHIQTIDTINSFEFIKKIMRGDSFFEDAKEEWCQRIYKVENYKFGFKYPELNKKGFITFSDKETIEKVYFDLESSLVDEVLNFARKISYIDPILRKKIEFAVFHFKWKSQEIQRQIQYDCNNCLKNKWIEQRVCFRDCPKQTVQYPVFDDEAKVVREIRRDEKEATVDDLYEWLLDMETVFTTAPAYEIMKDYMKPICPESLIDNVAAQYFRLESAVDAYGLEVLKHPFWIFEIFEAIRSASNTYDNLENFKRAKSVEKQQQNKR